MGTRDEMLKYLEKKRGEYVSGADLARELGVSGTAIWKAARKLKADGYMIEAVTNKGYRLSPDSDILSAEAIHNYLVQGQDLSADMPHIEVFHTIDSTNNVCRSKAVEGEADGYIAAAANQTAGRGRRGRSFFSPDDTGLYLSILLRPSGYTAQQALRFTTMAAVAVCEAIEEVSGSKAEIKWVNDIFMNDHKVCGILTEASFDLESGSLDYAIVGIGINVFEPEGGFPEEIKDIAGAVFGPYDRNAMPIPDIRSRLAAALIRRFMFYYHGAMKSSSLSYIEEYKRRCFVIGRNINVIMAGKAPVRAKALDIDNECGLLVRYEDGTEEVLSSGEISIRV